MSLAGLIGNVIIVLNNPITKKVIAETPVPIIIIQYVMMFMGPLILILCGSLMLKGYKWSRLLYMFWHAFILIYSLITSPLKPIDHIPAMVIYVVFIIFLFLPVANRYFNKIEDKESELPDHQAKRGNSAYQSPFNLWLKKRPLVSAAKFGLILLCLYIVFMVILFGSDITHNALKKLPEIILIALMFGIPILIGLAGLVTGIQKGRPGIGFLALVLTPIGFFIALAVEDASIDYSGKFMSSSNSEKK